MRLGRFLYICCWLLYACFWLDIYKLRGRLLLHSCIVLSIWVLFVRMWDHICICKDSKREGLFVNTLLLFCKWRITLLVLWKSIVCCFFLFNWKWKMTKHTIRMVIKQLKFFLEWLLIIHMSFFPLLLFFYNVLLKESLD